MEYYGFNSWPEKEIFDITLMYGNSISDMNFYLQIEDIKRYARLIECKSIVR
jgi:hypothetical protein